MLFLFLMLITLERKASIKHTRCYLQTFEKTVASNSCTHLTAKKKLARKYSKKNCTSKALEIFSSADVQVFLVTASTVLTIDNYLSVYRSIAPDLSSSEKLLSIYYFYIHISLSKYIL